ncbi:MAG: dipicolinate synthase subunit B [Eubacteriales bacterium]|nr:dipicolinate synthase subunit B [Eubacteriales bacterium]
MKKTTVGFALTGSFCTLEKAFAQMEELVRRGYEVLPILSENVARMDTRFFAAAEVKERAEQITGHAPLLTLQDVEPLGPKRMTDVYIIAPATATCLARLAGAVFDSPVLLGAKSHLRNERPLVLAVSTNDGLGTSAQNIGRLLTWRNVYFVPFRQDAPFQKPRSLVADFDQLPKTIASALCGVQLQPLLAGCESVPG